VTRYPWMTKLGTMPYGNLTTQRIPVVGEAFWIYPVGQPGFRWVLRRLGKNDEKYRNRGGIRVRVCRVNLEMTHLFLERA